MLSELAHAPHTHHGLQLPGLPAGVCSVFSVGTWTWPVSLHPGQAGRARESAPGGTQLMEDRILVDKNPNVGPIYIERKQSGGHLGLWVEGLGDDG